MITPKQVFDAWRDSDLLGFDPPQDGETYRAYRDRIGEEALAEDRLFHFALAELCGEDIDMEERSEEDEVDYDPPGQVQKFGGRRFPRWVIRDHRGRYWAGEGRWSDRPGDALLFCRRIDATAARDRHCLGGSVADTFTAKVTVSVHTGSWSTRDLAAHLRRHRRFCVGGTAGRGGLLLEIVPSTLRKVKTR